jgi:N-acetyl-gamma-glutamyl-phosphate reductase
MLVAVCPAQTFSQEQFMAKPAVFIDGHSGTTGLVIHEALQHLDQIEVLTLSNDRRKDPEARQDMLNRADLAVLCLPDDAAREAVGWVENPATRILDASTAHRVADGWVYGLPELSTQQRRLIAEGKRVANPGCYPNTPILLLRPLIETGLLPASLPVVVYGLSGYSGGGNALIDKWEDAGNGLLDLPHDAPYALERLHKHIPEMTHYALLEQPPQFIPAVGPFRCGMRVQIPLHASLLPPGVTAQQLWQTLHERYAGEPFVHVAPLQQAIDEHSLDPRAFNGSNNIELAVIANPGGHVLLVGRLDNLGKGAGGAALQNLNLMLGLVETTGLLV